MRKEKSCGAVILNKKGQILLIKHNEGHWSFPKGHMEEGETEKQTALREIWEETGLKVDIIESIREVSTYSPEVGVIKDVVYFLAFSEDAHVILQKTEVCDYKWLSYENSMKLITHSSGKTILSKIYSQYLDVSFSA